MRYLKFVVPMLALLVFGSIQAEESKTESKTVTVAGTVQKAPEGVAGTVALLKLTDDKTIFNLVSVDKEMISKITALVDKKVEVTGKQDGLLTFAVLSIKEKVDKPADKPAEKPAEKPVEKK